MSDDATIEQRAAQPYVGLRATTTMADLPGVIDTGWPRVFGWLGEHGLAFAGSPFLRYLQVDMERGLVIDLGVPIEDDSVVPDGGLHVDALPAGRWVSVRHVGSYDGLIAANAQAQEWAAARGLAFDVDDETWRGRVEHYVSDPREVPADECITFVEYLLRED